MPCEHCGGKIPDDSIFCPICGKLVEVSTAHTDPADKVKGHNTGPLILKTLFSLLLFCVLVLCAHHVLTRPLLSEQERNEQAYAFANTYAVQYLNSIGLNVYHRTLDDKPIYTILPQEQNQFDVKILYLLESDAIRGNSFPISFHARVKCDYSQRGVTTGTILNPWIGTENGLSFDINDGSFDKVIETLYGLSEIIDGLDSFDMD